MEFFNIEMQDELMAIVCPTKKAAKKVARQEKKETGKKQKISKMGSVYVVSEKSF